MASGITFSCPPYVSTEQNVFKYGDYNTRDWQRTREPSGVITNNHLLTNSVPWTEKFRHDLLGEKTLLQDFANFCFPERKTNNAQNVINANSQRILCHWEIAKRNESHYVWSFRWRAANAKRSGLLHHADARVRCSDVSMLQCCYLPLLRDNDFPAFATQRRRR